MTEVVPRSVDGRELTKRGAATRRRLLDAAEVCFAETGYHDASVVKVTEKAGVGQDTFYLYFASKRDIFDELVRDLNRRVRQAMQLLGAPLPADVERPLEAAAQDRDHARLQAQLTTPICLDESIHSVHDARKALDLGSCRIINIKV